MVIGLTHKCESTNWSWIGTNTVAKPILQLDLIRLLGGDRKTKAEQAVDLEPATM